MSTLLTPKPSTIQEKGVKKRSCQNRKGDPTIRSHHNLCSTMRPYQISQTSSAALPTIIGIYLNKCLTQPRQKQQAFTIMPPIIAQRSILTSHMTRSWRRARSYIHRIVPSPVPCANPLWKTVSIIRVSQLGRKEFQSRRKSTPIYPRVQLSSKGITCESNIWNHYNKLHNPRGTQNTYFPLPLKSLRNSFCIWRAKHLSARS